MKKYILVSICFILITSFNFAENKEISFFFFDDNIKNFYEKYFKIHGIEHTVDGAYIKINYDINLIKNILQIEKLRMEIIRNNIANALTTRTTNGEFYYRQYIDLNSEGEVIIKEDKDSNPRIVYDPLHPDSIKEEKLNGYVLYPNIYLPNECYDLIIAIQFYNGIVDYIQRNNIGIVIEKIMERSIESK